MLRKILLAAALTTASLAVAATPAQAAPQCMPFIAMGPVSGGGTICVDVTPTGVLVHVRATLCVTATGECVIINHTTTVTPPDAGTSTRVCVIVDGTPVCIDLDITVDVTTMPPSVTVCASVDNAPPTCVTVP